VTATSRGIPKAWSWARSSGPAAWRALGRLERLGAVLALATGLALLLAALGPPTDADSLDYHLGAPLEWLRQGRFVSRPDWLSLRLSGLGEGLNMVGLAAGTDTLGAILAVAGMGCGVVAASSLAQRPGDRVLAALLVVTCPLMMFLVPSQKPQLLPAVGLALAVALAVTRWGRMGPGSIVLASTGIAFAPACKYSMGLPAATAAILLLIAARPSGRVGWAVVSLGLMGVALVGPVIARNLIAYGDPVSPLLERWKSSPDSAVVGFARMLREYGRDPVAGPGWAALQLLLPMRPGLYGTALGLGGLAAFASGWSREAAVRTALACAGVVVVGVLAAGQVSARFLLEPYLWLAMVAAAAPWGWAKHWLFLALLLQGAVAAIAAGGLAASLAPGALSARAREAVMNRSALGALEWQWLDVRLPKRAIVLVTSRSRALATRAFEAADRVAYSSAREEELLRLVRGGRADVAVVGEPLTAEFEALERSCGAGSWASPSLELPVRNPWNRGVFYSLRIMELDRSRPTCKTLLDAAQVGQR
jgi:hypothetical protein